MPPTYRAVLAGSCVALVAASAFGDRRHLMAASAPPAPANLSASVQNSAVALTWSPGPGTVGPIAYQFEAGSVGGASNLLVMPVDVPNLYAPSVPDGLYFVRVRAFNGGGLSEPSNELAVRVGCVAPPPPPHGLSSNVIETLVSINWPPVADATGYVLEAGSAPGTADVGAVPLTSPGLSTMAPFGVYFVRVRATNRCGTSAPSEDLTVQVGVDYPPPSGSAPIFGAVDPAILGSCTAAIHDRWTVDGGDGFRYRTWHPQVDLSGCIFAHEHGDNPAQIRDPDIAASPVRFGYVGRRHPMPGEPNGHDEAHEGFKVFVANPGDVNDEGRVNRVYSRSVFHMGTGGPRRFTMAHHSAEIRLIHPEFGLKAFTQLMMDTGGVGAVCDPRAPAPNKDVMRIDFPLVCRGQLVGSGYEIWSTLQSVRHQGQVVYTAFATPAVFDPITVLNPANPTELVYASDPRMTAIRQFRDDWSTNRGCERESYAQPGYWYNGGRPTQYFTDAMGEELAASNPLALLQEISASDSISPPATNDGLNQFKRRRSYCQFKSWLGPKN